MGHKKSAPPFAFLILLLPFGISAGYAGVTLAFMLGKAGLAAALITQITANATAPQMFKFLWAPVVDATWRPKAWYALGAVLTGGSILALSLVPAKASAAGWLILWMLISSIASTLISMSCEILMAYQVDDARKGEVSGWSQAGNLGGYGLGGGLGLYIAQHSGLSWAPGVSLALICVLSGLPLLMMDEPLESTHRARYLDSVKAMGRDVWVICSSRLGLQVLLLMLLPLGSGGAQQVFPAAAAEWRVGPDTVALVLGGLGGLASMAGAVPAGFICDRIDRRLAYCLFGVLVGLVAVVMALAPRTGTVFVVGNLAYSVGLGACYAAYSAAVLDAIGKGAAATKFNIMAAASNFPIWAMGQVDGQLHDRLGSGGMLFGEAGAAVAAALGFGLLVALMRPRAKPTAAAA